MASPPVTDWAEDEVEGFGRSYEEKRSYLLNVAVSALRGRNASTPVDMGASRGAASKHSVFKKGAYGSDGHESAITSADASERPTSVPQSSDEQASRVAATSNSAAAAATAARGWQSPQASLQGRGRQGLDEAFGRISMQSESTGTETMNFRTESPAKERERHRKRSGFDSAEAAALNARILGDTGGEANETGTAPWSTRTHANRVHRELPSQPPYRAYVGHVPAQVQEDQIRQFFDGCRISRVRLLRRGPAPPGEVTEPVANGHEATTASLSEESAVRAVFVDFADAESLSEALKRHGALLDGCAVVVDIAQHAGNSSHTDSAGTWGASSRSRRAHRPQMGFAPERSETQSSVRNKRGAAPGAASRSSASGRYVNGSGSSSTAVHLGRSHKPSRRGWVHVPEAHRGQQSKEQEAKPAPTTSEKPAATVLSRNNFAALASLDSSLSDEEH